MTELPFTRGILPLLLGGMLLAGPGLTEAQAPEAADEIAVLKAQVAALSARLAELEAASGRTAVAVEDLGARVSAPAAAPPAAAPPAAAWAERVAVSGDLRYRHEWIDEEGSRDRHRQRVRARLGVSAEVKDDVDVHLQLATGGAEPRSTNQTLGGNFATKDVGIDLAYFDWSALEGVNVLGGKMRNPVVQPRASRFIDSDITPEGLALVWAGERFFVQGAGFWGVERGGDADTYALLAQAGYRGKLGDAADLTAAVSYTDWFNARGFAPFYDDDPYGNSVDGDGNLLYDYDLLEGNVELGLALAGRPLTLFAQYGVNTAADDDDTAWSAGLTLGRASAPGSWELGYAYHDMEKDSLFAQVVDSDMADGQTDIRGHAVTGGYAVSRALRLNLTYFKSELAVSSDDKRDYDRLMLDVNFRY